MSFKERIGCISIFSTPALVVAAWFVTDAYSNWIDLAYGAAIYVALIAIPVWIGTVGTEIRYRRNALRQKSIVPWLSLAYPPLYISFFPIVGFFKSEVDELDWVDAHGYASPAGLVIGAWAWYGIVILTFFLLSFMGVKGASNHVGPIKE